MSDIRVLIIDDSRVQHKLAKLYLEAELIKTFHANNGKEGIEMALKEKPDMIVLDIEMPEMDGIETLKNLKNNPEIMNIPVLMCSSLKDEEIVSECMTLGAAGYINKPHGYRGFRDNVVMILGPEKIKQE